MLNTQQLEYKFILLREASARIRKFAVDFGSTNLRDKAKEFFPEEFQEILDLHARLCACQDMVELSPLIGQFETKSKGLYIKTAKKLNGF